MKIGLIGLDKSGKTTIFNALTGLHADTDPFAPNQETNLGTVQINDERVDKLVEIYKPKKTVYPTIEYLDLCGIDREHHDKDIFPPGSIALLKTADALAIVLRNFASDFQTEPLQPTKDLETIEAELIFSDMMSTEKRLDKIELSKKRGIKDTKLMLEEKVLVKCNDALQEGKSLRCLDFDKEEEKLLKGFQFLSKKPAMVIVNSGEENYSHDKALRDIVPAEYSAIEFAGKLEMDLVDLSDEDRAEFLREYEIERSARHRLTALSYDVLGLISFFTVGEKEVHAWTIKRGMIALDAAEKIHTDLARGFIRAECFKYEDLVKYGSEKALREKGLIRLEGKTYQVQDGDVLIIRFNV